MERFSLFQRLVVHYQLKILFVNILKCIQRTPRVKMFIEVLKNDVFKNVHEYEAYVFTQ